MFPITPRWLGMHRKEELRKDAGIVRDVQQATLQVSARIERRPVLLNEVVCSTAGTRVLAGTRAIVSVQQVGWSLRAHRAHPLQKTAKGRASGNGRRRGL